MSAQTFAASEHTKNARRPIRVFVDSGSLGATVAVVACLVTAWSSFGVGSRDIAGYLGYQSLAVVLPGVLLATILDRRPLSLRHLCVGVPLGLLLTMVGLVVLAAVGLRGLAPWASSAFAVAAALFLARERRHARPVVARAPRPEFLVVAAIALISIFLMASRDFPSAPLPSEITSSVRYYPDLLWQIDNVVTLKRDWPPKDLRAAGEPLKYYIGYYLQAAQTSVAMGIAPATLVLRLDPLFLLALLAAQLFWLGRLVGGRARVGLLTAVLVLLVGDLSSLRPATTSIFGNLVLTDMYLSPTYLIGLVFFVPLLGLAAEWHKESHSTDAGRIAALTLLTLGVGLTKTAALAIVMLTGAVMFLPDAIFRRRLFLPGAVLTGAAVLTYGVLFPLVHVRGQEGALQLDILGTVRWTQGWRLLRSSPVDLLPHHILPAVLVVLANTPLFLLGLTVLLVLRRQGPGLHLGERMLLVTTVVGAGFLLALTSPREDQFYFWFYAYISLAALGAIGIDALLSAPTGWRRRFVLGAAAALTALCVGSTVLQAGPHARRIIADVVPGVPGPFHTKPPTPNELTRPVLRGLLWLRSHSNSQAVVTVNNQSSFGSRHDDRYFYYSAFSQRQILLEGFAYSPEFYLDPTSASAADLKRRLTLLNRIYRRGSAAAIDEARHLYGVGYLLVDRRDGLPQHEFPRSATRLIFSDSQLAIYAVVPPASGPRSTG